MRTRRHRHPSLAPTAVADREGIAVVPEAVGALSVHRSSVPTTDRSRTSAFAALEQPAFLRYTVGQILSAAGSFVQQTGLGWLVLQLTGSASTLGLVLAVGGVPGLLLGPLGGSVADRFDNRRLLIATQTALAVLGGALWVLAVRGRAGVAAIVVISVANGVVSIVDLPARQAFVSQLVQRSALPSAIGLNGVVMNSARVVGPAVAGVLIVSVGTSACFLVNAVSYVVFIVALVSITPISPPASTGVASGGLAVTLGYVRRYQQLWLPLVMMAVVGLLAFNFNVVLPLLAKTTFGGDGGTLGLLTTLISIGSVAGSLSVSLIPHPQRRYLVLTAALFGLALAFAALAPTVATEGAALVLTGLFGFQFVNLCSESLQLHSTPGLRGRVMALWVFVYLGTTPVGNVFSGWVGRISGPRSVLWVGAAACLVVAAVASRVRTPPPPDDVVIAGPGGTP